MQKRKVQYSDNPKKQNKAGNKIVCAALRHKVDISAMIHHLRHRSRVIHILHGMERVGVA